jgi:hypothetical protein
MKLKITKAIHSIMNKRFEQFLVSGAFPSVQYEKTDWGRKFNLFEYSDAWCRFSKLVDEKMKLYLHEEFGVFTRKHSAEYLKRVEDIVCNIQATEAENYAFKFKSFLDQM